MRTPTKRLVTVLLIAVVSFVLFGFIYRLLGLPEADEFISIARSYYAQYGYWVVFLAALGEGLLFINWYLPGSAVAVLGVVFARENNQSVPLVIFLIMLAFLLTAVINYLIGRYGWYRLFLRFGLKTPLENSRLRLEKKGLPIILSSYFHPNIGALTATSAGIIQANFQHFLLYSAIAYFVWGIIWGVIVYFFGPQLLALGTVQLMAVIVVGWAVYLIGKAAYENRQAPHDRP
ncbi:MAG: VTT domain-containing protein [Candidatus Berkelbacteria bacterium]|nr:MAG: VTT domain-containing protein [Candidatus Berkelbacteria bacterium]QQG51760.1 MAG: VTT domain-containing protein [Candidatus Berkelbacteria bacterium]